MINDILDGLWKNWMFRLSLSSNELFHSNFLQTVLSDPMPDLIDEHAGATSWARVNELANASGLDGEWLEERQRAYDGYPVFVYREWKNLDLAIVVRLPLKNNRYREIVIFAVELKIKSYPTLDQIQRYLGLMTQHNGEVQFIPRLVLLSLIQPPPSFGQIENLTISHFGHLADGLARLNQFAPTLQPAIAEYIRLCHLLHQLSNIWSTSLHAETALHMVTGKANIYRRLNPIWCKLSAAYLCELVRQEMTGFVLKKGISLKILPDFSHRTWRADFLWYADAAVGAAEGIISNVGVQVEGNTIRFMLNAQNLAVGGGNARQLVQDALLAEANASGLYEPLYRLYQITDDAAEEHRADLIAVWQERPGIRLDNAGMPCLGAAQGNFILPGYNNNATFGHADYRLKLREDATLTEISQLVCAALRGEYNANGSAAFLPVLTNRGRLGSMGA